MEDKIIIKGLKVFAYHGVNKEEKVKGQKFIIDCILYVNRYNKRFDDKVSWTISYSEAAEVINNTMLFKSYNLIETTAEYVARDLFYKFDRLMKVEIVLKKPQAPINMEFDYMAINIFRKREDFID